MYIWNINNTELGNKHEKYKLILILKIRSKTITTQIPNNQWQSPAKKITISNKTDFHTDVYARTLVFLWKVLKKFLLLIFVSKNI